MAVLRLGKPNAPLLGELVNAPASDPPNYLLWGATVLVVGSAIYVVSGLVKR